MAPETRYARSRDGVSLAYQVVGDAPVDLLYVPTFLSQVEQLWEEPRVARYFERIASFARLILFDRRGFGLSDPMARPPGLDEQMDDVLAVLDAAGSERAAVFAQLEAGPMAILFAATHPDRTSALILYATYARSTATDGYEWTDTAEQRGERMRRMVEEWGQGTTIDSVAPSLAGDPAMRRWMARLQRLSASPGTMRSMIAMSEGTDVRDVLPAIRVPTLVMHRTHDSLMDIRHSRYLAERIPGARYVELPGTDALLVAGDPEPALEEIEELLTGSRHAREPDRILATVLFTDVVGSTETAAVLGDRRWRDLLARHHDVVRRALSAHGGREVKTVGDGFLAAFDGPARAIRAAGAIVDAVGALGLPVRVGLHTGEVEVIGDDLGGMAVHIGARVVDRARAGEVLVSSTVKDLVVGSGFEFTDEGAAELRGVPGEWRLFRVAR